ncbi:MAG: dTMP kinase [Planctomycetota bacterium]
MFFSFDGVDGVGKSTQLEHFCQWLRGRGREVTVCRDPGSTPLGERVREILLASGDETPIGGRAEMLLYMAARAQLVDQVIRPALAAGRTVVSDRFLLANLVYQGHAGGLPVGDVAAVGEVAIAGVRPACTFLLDMDPRAADKRITRDRDRMEQRGDAYRQKLREGFLSRAAADPAVHVVDADQSVEAVQAAIRQIAGRVM